jgi:lipoyl(octanoyl) transferase
MQTVFDAGRAAESPAPPEILVRELGRVSYEGAWHAMRSFTAARTPITADELWLLEHPPVYTVGVAGRAVHLPKSDNGIAVVHTDRGGQITFHGPGQLVVYLLLDMKRRALTVRPLVRAMEGAVIDLLAEYAIAAESRPEAPGVYVRSAKIAAVGLRVTRGCCYHGLALNVDMDLSPFHAIDPCGYPGLAVSQLRDLGVSDSVSAAGARLLPHLRSRLT